MIYSKNLMVIIFLSLGLVLASCGKKNDRLTDVTTSSTFYVDNPVRSDGTVLVKSFSNNYADHKIYNLKACFKDNALNQVIQFIPFQVQAGLQTIEVKTDVYGCIYWSESVKFDPRASDAYLKIERSFSALSGHSGTVTVPMALYPWDKSAKITIADLRNDLVGRSFTVIEDAVDYVDLKSVDVSAYNNSNIIMRVKENVVENYTAKLKGKSVEDLNRVMPTSKTFTLNFDKHDEEKYEVDTHLNLKIAHRYQFKMPISFLRDNLAEGLINESFLTGKVNVYLTVLNDKVDPIANDDLDLFKNNILASSKFQGRIELGDIIGYTSLIYKNISSLPGRNYIIVTLESVSREMPFKNFSIAGQVTGLPAGRLVLFDYVNLSAKDLNRIFEEQSQKVKNQESPLALLKNSDGVVDLAQLPKYKIPGAELTLYRSFYESQIPKELNSELCDQVLGVKAPSALVRSCRRKPSDFLSVTKREFVESLNSITPKRVSPYFKTDTLSVNVSYAKNLSLTQSTTTSLKGSLGLGINLGFNLGAKFGGDWSGKKDLTEKPVPPSTAPAPGSGAPATQPSTVGDEPAFKYTKFLSNGLSGGLNFGLSGSAGGNFDRTWMRSLQNSKSRTVSVTAATTLTLMGESAAFEIDAKTRQCIIATPNIESLEQLEKYRLVPKRMAIVCNRMTQAKKVIETYYLIHQSNGVAGSPFSDPVSSSQAPWRMFIRGNGVYNFFKELVSSPDLELVLERVPEFDKAKTQFISSIMDQEFPGLVDEAELAKCKNNGFIDKWMDNLGECSW